MSEISCKLRRRNRKNKIKVLVRSVSAKTQHLLTYGVSKMQIKFFENESDMLKAMEIEGKKRAIAFIRALLVIYNDDRKFIVTEKDQLVKVIDMLTYADLSYVMTPAKVRDKSFQRVGETNYKTVWVFDLVRPLNEQVEKSE